MNIENKVLIAGETRACIVPADLRKDYNYTRFTYELYLPFTSDEDTRELRAISPVCVREEMRLLIDRFWRSLKLLSIITSYSYVGRGYWLVECFNNTPIAWIEYIADTYVGVWRVCHPFACYETQKGWE